MRQLNPTLWRTCRALTGRTRLGLLRQVLEQPGLNVSQLAERLKTGISDASQELRRLQSRGLLRRSCRGASVVYLPLPDPQVPSAAPLLKALQAAWNGTCGGYEEIALLAKGLACERRVSVVRALSQGPKIAAELSDLVRTGPDSLKKHLRILRETGWVVKAGKSFVLRPASHPVQTALLNLL
jgi:DNA-binding transcriptional ArsR family regulator